MKINKKKVAITIAVIIVIIIIIVTTIVVFTTNTKKDKSITDINMMDVVIDGENHIDLKSSKHGKIEKDDIEIEELDIKIIGDQLEVILKLKNNSKETVKEASIDIALLDSSGNKITSFLAITSQELKPNKSIEEKYYLVEVETPELIRNAKIISIEKSNGINQMIEDFESVEKYTE